MKIIKTGSSFNIYGDDLKVLDKLPVGTYNLAFDRMRGPFLQKVDTLSINEEKIYGSHTEKLQKVLGSYQIFDRSMGVILSGAKGIGKSLFARLLCDQAKEIGMPVLIADGYFPGFAEFIDSIDQEAVVLFDEFEKNFARLSEDDTEEASPQSRLLGLFDGVSSKKKLYVITCNDTYKLNDFYLNRPGRFHYHIRFQNPDHDEINTYMKDKVQEQFWGEIKKVQSFAARVPVNYDTLRAIAFELNTGATFNDLMEDLNFSNEGNKHRFDIQVNLTNGEVLMASEEVDLFSRTSFWASNNDMSIRIVADMNNAVVDEMGGITLDGNHVAIRSQDFSSKGKYRDADECDMSLFDVSQISFEQKYVTNQYRLVS